MILKKVLTYRKLLKFQCICTLGVTLEILTSEAFPPCVIILSSKDSKYSRFLYYKFSYMFFLCFWLSFLPPLILIFCCDILAGLCKNEALDQKYSNLCAYTRSRACLLTMKSGSDASRLSAAFCQTLRESCHLAQIPPLVQGLPKPVSGLSAPIFWLTEPTDSALIVTPFTMPRKQMEWKK